LTQSSFPKKAYRGQLRGQWLSVQELSPDLNKGAGTLFVATPKKIAKHAVHRNMVRRVLKEQWRCHALHGVTSVLVRLLALPAQAPNPASPPKTPKDRLALRLTDGALKRAVASDAQRLFNQLLAKRS
jgi:hypothetical protein